MAYSPNTIITDAVSGYQATVTAPSTSPGVSDQALVIGISPSGNQVTLADSEKNTYSACVIGLLAPANPTDIFTLTGSATKIVKITRVGFFASQSTSAFRDVVLLRRSTANSAGSSTTPTIVSYDTTNPSPTAVVRAYTVNPTLGTLAGNFRVYKFPMVASPTSTTSAAPTPSEWFFGDKQDQSVTLRDASQVFAINLNGVTSAGNLCDIFITWTEE